MINIFLTVLKKLSLHLNDLNCSNRSSSSRSSSQLKRFILSSVMESILRLISFLSRILLIGRGETLK